MKNLQHYAMWLFILATVPALFALQIIPSGFVGLATIVFLTLHVSGVVVIIWDYFSKKAAA